MTRHWPTLLGSLVRVDDIRRAISEAYRVRDETVGLLSPSLELPLEFDCQNQFNLQHVVGCGALFSEPVVYIVFSTNHQPCNYLVLRSIRGPDTDSKLGMLSPMAAEPQ